MEQQDTTLIMVMEKAGLILLQQQIQQQIQQQTHQQQTQQQTQQPLPIHQQKHRLQLLVPI